MFESLASYAEWIELETFFSGFIVVYAVYWLFFRSAELPVLSYALAATLYFGLQIRNYYPDFNLQQIFSEGRHPVLKIAGMMAVLFWIPALRKKTLLAIIHGALFFILITGSLYTHLITDPDSSLLNNDLKILAASLAINSCSLILIFLVTRLINSIGKTNGLPDNSQGKP